MTIKEKTKAFLFARWIATCYLEILNTENGAWWKVQLEHFEKVVYPNYMDNNTAKDTTKFLQS